MRVCLSALFPVALAACSQAGEPRAEDRFVRVADGPVIASPTTSPTVAAIEPHAPTTMTVRQPASGRLLPPELRDGASGLLPLPPIPPEEAAEVWR